LVPHRHRGGPETVDAKETNVIILLPLLRCLNARARLALGLALTTLGLVLIIAALAHGVIAVIMGAIFLASVGRRRQAERLTYPSH
jgi:hypothetical protein